jgi:hypothetical protein
MFIVWYSVRHKQPTLSLAYSDDGAKTFSQRIPVAEGVLDPNHPFLNAIGDRVALVFQGRPSLRGQNWAPVNVYYREVDAQARVSRLHNVGHAGASAAYPVFAFEDPERIYVAWTEPHKEGKGVVLARGRRIARAAGVTDAAN